MEHGFLVLNVDESNLMAMRDGFWAAKSMIIAVVPDNIISLEERLSI
jgi:hypothetical protein